ncbi:MAG: FAD-binding oxidoreductase [Armatimonadetes bacterium]|nr:FAD-binding oxidoreductase [Armatimonadota bacterium]
MTTLPAERLERVEGWGMASAAMGYVYRPSTVDGLCAIFDEARRTGRPIGLRGAGRSYGDAALNAEGIVLDLTRMSRILDWNPDTGTVTVEPGVTVQQLWQHTIEDGWWPHVVPGTMFPTLGGAAAMNIHGKNNWKVGPIGDHIEEFDLMLPSGEVKTCSRAHHADLFHAAISGFGMFGVMTRLTLRLKRVYSGLLNVEPIPHRSLAHLFDIFEERLARADYLVGWIDCFAEGDGLGRGLVHQANYLAPGEDPQPAQTLRVANQELPDTLFGVVPKSLMWRFMKPFANNPGMRLVNFAKYLAGEKAGVGQTHHQSHAGFAFLLDYVPHWQFSYKPGGLIQYQSFVPAAHAQEVFSAQLRLAQSYGIVPWLGVFKRHRPDDFLMTHAVDGYSLALDFAVRESARGGLLSLAAEMDRLVLDAGGRFYFAKDSALHRASVRDALGADRVDKFFALKAECDPETLLQTNLYRRLLAPLKPA